MPGPAGQVLVNVEIGGGQDVESGAFVMADPQRQHRLELFPEANVEHAGIERPSPHAHIEPARAWKRAYDSTRQHQTGGCDKNSDSFECIVFQTLSPASECSTKLSRDRQDALPRTRN